MMMMILIIIIITIIIIIIGIKIKTEHTENHNTWDSENIKEASRDLKRIDNSLVTLGCLLQLDLNGKLPGYNQN